MSFCRGKKIHCDFTAHFTVNSPWKSHLCDLIRSLKRQWKRYYGIGASCSVDISMYFFTPSMPLAIYHQECGLEETTGENTADILFTGKIPLSSYFHCLDVHCAMKRKSIVFSPAVPSRPHSWW